MSNDWMTIFDEVIDNRPVQIEFFCQGGYKIQTVQKEDEPGSVIIDSCSTAIFSPTEKGRIISMDCETLNDVKRDLLSVGFGDAQVDSIMKKLS